MSHEIEKQYKVITARSAEDITNEINYLEKKRNFYTPKAFKEFCETEEFKKFEKEIVEKYEKKA